MADTVPEDLTYEVEYEGLRVSRLEGWGNSFYVVLVAQSELDLDQTAFADEGLRARLAKRWCSGSQVEIHGHAIPPGDDESGRGVGDGTDGLIFGLYREHRDGGVELGSQDQVADARMVLHNADGSPAEMSGNGIRCFAHSLALLARKRGLRRAAAAIAAPASPKDAAWRSVSIRFETDAGPRNVRLLVQPTDDVDWPEPVPEGGEPRLLFSVAAMGAVTEGPKLTAKQKRLAKGRFRAIDFETRSVGNPHFIIHVPPSTEPEVATVDRDALERLGAELARAAEPEHAINVEFISVDPSAVDIRTDGDLDYSSYVQQYRRRNNGIKMLVWERGVGPTLACGTGAVAAAQQAADWGLVDPDEPIEVRMSEHSAATVRLFSDSAWLEGPTRQLSLDGYRIRLDLQRPPSSA